MNWLANLSHGTMWNRTARTCRLTHDPQRMLARIKYLKQRPFIMAKGTMSVCYGPMATSSSRITTFRHWCNLNLSRSGSLETQHYAKENYAKTIDEDLQEGNVITVPDAHMVEKRSDKEWYLPHHPLINPNKPGSA